MKIYKEETENLEVCGEHTEGKEKGTKVMPFQLDALAGSTRILPSLLSLPPIS